MTLNVHVSDDTCEPVVGGPLRGGRLRQHRHLICLHPLRVHQAADAGQPATKHSARLSVGPKVDTLEIPRHRFVFTSWSRELLPKLHVASLITRCIGFVLPSNVLRTLHVACVGLTGFAAVISIPVTSWPSRGRLLSLHF